MTRSDGNRCVLNVELSRFYHSKLNGRDLAESNGSIGNRYYKAVEPQVLPNQSPGQESGDEKTEMNQTQRRKAIELLRTLASDSRIGSSI